MPYVLSSDPIPQNSLMPPPAEKGLAANARRMRVFMESRTGRERLYANLPTVEDLAGISLPLAVDAQGMIQASEAARQTILNGVGNAPAAPTLMEDLASIIANAPQVLSLNGSAAVGPAMTNTGAASPTGGNTVVYPTLPARAPIQFWGGFLDPPGYGAGGYLASVKQLNAWKNRGGPVPAQSVALTQDQRGPSSCGLSGFSPAWGDAFIQMPQAQTPAGPLGWLEQNPWLAGAGVIALVGVAAFARKGRRRR